MTTLRINELFTSLQGEGPSLGRPVTFLRLSVCNLHCGWCDTSYTWNFGAGGGETRWGLPTVRQQDEIHEWTVEEMARRLLAESPRHLVISGGEPMLQHAALAELLAALRSAGKWFVEIETNGTVPVPPEFLAQIDQINCSPKLANSGNVRAACYRPEVLRAYAPRAVFKFVVEREADLDEIAAMAADVGPELMTRERIWLMPQGKTKAEQEQLQDVVAAMAMEHGYRFTPRLHVLLWGEKRGV